MSYRDVDIPTEIQNIKARLEVLEKLVVLEKLDPPDILEERERCALIIRGYINNLIKKMSQIHNMTYTSEAVLKAFQTIENSIRKIEFDFENQEKK